jgi:type IV pilus assembly protein PilC
MQFAYRAKNQDGKLVKGAIESKDNTSAIASLQQKGLYVIEAREENAGSSFDLFKSKIALKDKIIFTKQLSLMIRSGLSIIDALRSLSDDSTNKMFSKIINSLIREVEGGLPLSQALDKHKDVFGTIYINMVKAGEKSGKVDVILERLAIQLEKDYELNRKVRGALSYPIFILVTMVVVVSLIVVIVIPQLKTSDLVLRPTPPSPIAHIFPSQLKLLLLLPSTLSPPVLSMSMAT